MSDPDSKNFEKVVTHNDFDGIISAALCTWSVDVDRVLFTGPLAITRSQMTITEKDIVCDLPYPLQCGLWFDHHEGNLQDLMYRKIDPKTLPGRFELKPSCSRVVHDYFSEQREFPPFFLEAVEEADVIDSFSYSSVEDWRKETPGKIVELTLKSRFPSPGDQTAYMRNVVQQLRHRPLGEVAGLPFVQKQLQQYREEEGRMLRIIKEGAVFLEGDERREVVVIDLTPHRRRPHLIKNLAFLVYPQALGVIEVYSLTDRGVKSNNLGLSMSLSIEGNKKTPAKNIGEIMRTLNIGDGHPGAAAGTIQCSSKQEMLKRKKDALAQILKVWASQ